MSARLRALTCFAGLIVLLASAAACADSGPLFRFTEKPGPHPVGLKVVEQYDYSRTFRRSTDEFGKPYPGERARPLQTLVWYPAEQGGGHSMTLADYGNLWATETSFGHPKLSEDAKEWLAAVKPLLATSLWAVRDAPPASGRFPVIIYGPGASSVSWENIDLCEYLASHGYVVVSSPDFGATTRRMTIDLAGINTQAKDMTFLIGFAQTLPDTDMSAVAVMGHSWGGISNVFAAARDSRVDALVALDGSLRYYPSLVKQAGDVHPERLTVPLLYFAQSQMDLEYAARELNSGQLDGPNVLNSWTHGDLVLAHMLGLAHAEFSTKWQRDQRWWTDYPQYQPADYGREDAIAGYAWMARYTLAFLNGYLKHDGAAMNFLKKTPAENGVPAHLMTVTYRPAEGPPVSFDAFRAETGRQGFDHAADIYAAFQKQQPNFKLEEADLIYWTNQLMADDHPAQAVTLLELTVQMYPDSAEDYISLGNAYRQAGQKDRAIESYHKALAKDPENGPAKRKLAELSSQER